MSAQCQELTGIVTQFAESGWDVIDAPAKTWLGGATDAAKKDLIAAVEKADAECGSCGCEMDPLYKKALELLRAS
ncbi:MAG: hypothetical protein LBI19_04450 [Oscillospiraceae bacterium]|jgi:hypothetical protein|nr:hypothetical protein [Oscillospiraceae bacterium]